jgi:hypothetical protein
MPRLPNNLTHCANITLKSLGYWMFWTDFGAPEYNNI